MLSIVQGATEFLPISSSGHLVLLYRVFRVEGDLVFLSVVLHFATLCSVLVVYRKQVLQVIKKPFSKLSVALMISTIVSLVVVLILKGQIESSFDGGFLILGFLITAIILMMAESMTVRSSTATVKLEQNVSHVQAIIIGVVQALAAFPGVSRSGATISAGIVVGVDKKIAADYSFLMSVPIVTASMLFELYEFSRGNVAINIPTLHLIVSFLLTFAVGVFCIKAMIGFIKKQRLYVFSYYLVMLSLFLIINDKVLFWF